MDENKQKANPNQRRNHEQSDSEQKSPGYSEKWSEKQQFITREERLRQLEKERGINQIYENFLNSEKYTDENTNKTKDGWDEKLHTRVINESSVRGRVDDPDVWAIRQSLRDEIEESQRERDQINQRIQKIQSNKDLLGTTRRESEFVHGVGLSAKQSETHRRSLSASNKPPPVGLRPKVNRPSLASAAKVYYSTDKTLLILLDDEREKYAQLEKEYYSLLSEVQSLQANHIRDLKLSTRKRDAEISTLQKTVLLKSDEIAITQKKLTETASLLMETKRRLDDSVEDSKKLEGQATRMNNVLLDTEAKLKDCMKEVKEWKDKYRKMESDWFKEKENRMKLDVQIIQLDHFVHQRDDQIQKLQSQLTTREKQLINQKTQLESLTKQVEEDKQKFTQIKSHYSSKMSSAQTIVQQLQAQLTESRSTEKQLHANLQQRDKTHSKIIQEYTTRIKELTTQLDAARTTEIELKNKIQTKDSAIDKCAETIAGLQAKLVSQIEDARGIEESLRNAIRQRDVTIAKTMDESQSRLVELQNQSREREERFAAELDSIRVKKQQELAAVQERFDKMKTAVDGECMMLRNQVNESNLLNRKLENALNESKSTLREMESELSQRILIIEKQEALIQEKAAVLDSMKSEISQLRMKYENAVSSDRDKDSQLAQSESVIRDQTNAIRERELKISMLQAQFSQKENAIAAQDSALAEKERAIATLQSQHRHEIQLLQLQNNALQDHVKRQQEELNGYRATNAQKDKDLQKLQASVSELSRRLRAQVDMLLETDNDSDGLPLLGERSRAQSAMTTSMMHNRTLSSTNLTAENDHKITPVSLAETHAAQSKLVYHQSTSDLNTRSYLQSSNTTNMQQSQSTLLQKLKEQQGTTGTIQNGSNSPNYENLRIPKISVQRSQSDVLNNPLLSMVPKVETQSQQFTPKSRQSSGVGRILVGMDDGDF